MEFHFFSLLQSVLGGLGVFLLGMRFLSDGLQTLAGERLNRWISAVTDNRFLSILVGILVTCVIQSSSATTVMVIGFVNSGLMTLMQGIGIVFGANIGTTLSLWLLTLDVSKYGELLVGVSVFLYLFGHKERWHYIGMLFMGLGMLFFGLKLMSDGFSPLRNNAEVIHALSVIRADTTIGFIKAILTGALITGIIQSSAAVIVIVMGLAGAQVIDFPTSVGIVLGSNIGTTVTAILACIGTSRNAFRVALAHTFFNLIGVVAIVFFWRPFVNGCDQLIKSIRTIPLQDNFASPQDFHNALSLWYVFAISCVHTLFNVATTAILIPFMNTIAKAVTFLIPLQGTELREKGYKPKYLDPLLIPQSSIAIGQSQKEILRMGETCLSMLKDLRQLLATKGDLDSDLEEEVFKAEEQMDLAQKTISEYIGKVLLETLPQKLSVLARRQLRQADEFESVSDYIRNALKSYKKIRDADENLSDVAREEVLGLLDRINDFLVNVIDYLTIGDAGNVEAAQKESNEIDAFAKKARDAHMQRIAVSCTGPVKTLVYSDLIVAFRRQNDHLFNIAQTLNITAQPHPQPVHPAPVPPAA